MIYLLLIWCLLSAALILIISAHSSRLTAREESDE